MQRLIIFLAVCAFGAPNYVITPPDQRPASAQKSYQQQGKIAPKITPAPKSQNATQAQGRGMIKPKIVPSKKPMSYSNSNMTISPQIKPASKAQQGIVSVPPVIHVHPTTPRESSTTKITPKIYPPLYPNPQDNRQNLNIYVSPSREITQDMMFDKVYTPPRTKIPPPIVYNVPPKTLPPPQRPREGYTDDDEEPLFIHNRNGVMLGAGIGGDFERLWVSGNNGNQRFYEDSFTYYFRLGYQHYFTSYLGVRAYAHLGHWANELTTEYDDGTHNAIIKANAELNYSFYFEGLYDFLVIGDEHSVGIFGGFGLGVAQYAFSNDDTQLLEKVFVLPMVSVGAAYTLFQNNRFEFEFKMPLLQGVLESAMRSEFSTWMIGVSYTYVF
ncbi:hypothetical protein BBW65_00965 [Helicobacter enhydrae]|uniref:Uncharacterized protein n=2 Tax=Helicobacter enhydrae TaxID=222136 RepID=A0A1B1U404_9HELI|nr:hypothetical protein BBW65_00965 [Helicobacter enhydrae]